MDQPVDRRATAMADVRGDAPDRDLHTALERARVRARIRAEVRSALRIREESPPSNADRGWMGEALTDAVRALHALGLTEQEALSDVRAAVDEVESSRRSTAERRALLSEAHRHVRELYAVGV